MELLLCIKSHPEGFVTYGQSYPFISDKPSCNCKDLIDVGVRGSSFIANNTGNTICIGDPVGCIYCKQVIPFDGIFWMGKFRFAMVSQQDETQAYQQKESGLLPMVQEL